MLAILRNTLRYLAGFDLAAVLAASNAPSITVLDELTGAIAAPVFGVWPRIAEAIRSVQAIGSVVLACAGQSVSLLLPGCALFGLGLGNVTSLPPLVAQVEFRAADVSKVVALVAATSQAGYAFAPAAFGLLREAGPTVLSGGEGTLLFAVAAALQLASAAVVLIGRGRRAPAVA